MHDRIIEAIAIMDEKGREDGNGSVMLWRRDFNRLREILLELDREERLFRIDIQQNIETVEGVFADVKIGVLQ